MGKSDTGAESSRASCESQQKLKDFSYFFPKRQIYEKEI
jgi:hypothetical protein